MIVLTSQKSPQLLCCPCQRAKAHPGPKGSCPSQPPYPILYILCILYLLASLSLSHSPAFSSVTPLLPCILNLLSTHLQPPQLSTDSGFCLFLFVFISPQGIFQNNLQAPEFLSHWSTWYFCHPVRKYHFFGQARDFKVTGILTNMPKLLR